MTPSADRPASPDRRDPGAEPELPDGWTIERLRRHSGDSRAEPLSLDRRVYVLDDRGDRTPLPRPDHILSFHEQCLVGHEGEWYLGLLGPDGSVCCWDASYGPDLAEAVRGL
ncbi:hypothetical protein [Streptomyces sp. NPDC046727]|uniref:hypothetical protein n=1 Tax=Streptomyces sp. NPDC046727 TaxID=3155373 RepID=UPI003406D9FA